MRKSTLQNREHILFAARRVIRERGVESTTLAEIAEVAKISKGTLYYHYATKGGLVFDIARRHMRMVIDKLLREVRKDTELSPSAILRRVFHTIMRYRSVGAIHVYLLQEVLAGNSEVQRGVAEEYRYWNAAIEAGLTHIYGRNERNAMMARIILSNIDGLLLQRLIGIQAIPIDEIAVFFEKSISSALVRVGDKR